MTKEVRISREWARPYLFDTSAMAAISLESMAGLWTLRFGIFGCRDEETHGGVLHIDGDRLASADGYFLLHGGYVIRDGGIEVTAQTIRCETGSPFDAIYRHPQPIFPTAFRAEAITPDHLEGRIQQPGYPDMRIVLRRSQPAGYAPSC